MQYSYPATHLLSAASSADIATIGDATGGSDSNFRFDHVVRVTRDSGRSWKEIYSQKVRYNQEWHALEHPTPDMFVVVGDTQKYLGQDRNGNQWNIYTAYLVLSRDGGTTWSTIYFDTNTVIRDVRMLSSTYGAAILTHSGNVYDSLPDKLPDDLLITTDGWKTWTTMTLPFGVKWCWQLVCFGEGEFGTFTWSASDHAYRYYRISQNNVVSRGLLPASGELYFINAQEGWCAGSYWSHNNPSGFVSHTSDGGLTWDFYADTVGNQTGDQLRMIAFADSVHGIAAGDAMLSTEDGGKTWHSSPLPYASMLNSNGGILYDLVYPRRDLAVAVLGSTLIRYSGVSTISTPHFLNIGQGPVPVQPTTIAWSTVAEAQKYQVQLRAYPMGVWIDTRHFYDEPTLDTIVTNSEFVYRDLDFSTAYHGRVRAISGTDTSEWQQSGSWQQPIALFYTITHPSPLPPVILEPPSGSHIGSSVKMTITTVPNAISYGVRFWMFGVIVRIDTTVSDTVLEINGIERDASYIVQVRANFPDDSTDWSGDYFLISDPLSAVENTLNGYSFGLYPNPAHEELRTPGSGPMVIFDALGRRQNVPVRYDATGAVLDVRSLPAGAYTILEGDDAKTMHFVVQH